MVNVYSVLSININMCFKRIGFSVKSFVYLAWLDNIIPAGIMALSDSTMFEYFSVLLYKLFEADVVQNINFHE